MEQISKLVWNQSIPEELLDLVRTLEEEYPISDSGRGLKLSFKRVEGDGVISNVIRTKGAVTVEYNTVSGNIESDFQTTQKGNQLIHSAGVGSTTTYIEVDTVSGNITLILLN